MPASTSTFLAVARYRRSGSTPAPLWKRPLLLDPRPLKGCICVFRGLAQAAPRLRSFSTGENLPAMPTAVNRPGFGHIAFAVDNVAAAQEAVLAAGGGRVGDVVTLQTSDGKRVTWCYVADPEGNVVELQSWS